MIKTLEVYYFYKSCSPKSKWLIIRSFIELPAVLVHEILHILMALILFVKINKVCCDYFYEIENNTLKTYQFSVHTSANTLGRLRSMFVNVAPLLSFIILPLISPYLIIWLVVSYRTFVLSSQDVINFKNNLNYILNLKSC